MQEPPEPAKADLELPLSEQAYRLIRQAILRGQIEPGSRLKIDTLRQEYTFSSSPLREALNRLVADSLVDIDDRRGFRAAGISIDAMRDITAFRLNIEPISLQESIVLGDDDWEAQIIVTFHRLERLEARVTEDRPQTDEWTKRHRAFHLALIGACPSQRQISVCANLFDHVERYRRLSLSWRTTKRDRTGEHRALMEAALRRDQFEAAALLRRHIEKTAVFVGDMLAARAQLAPSPRRAAKKQTQSFQE